MGCNCGSTNRVTTKFELTTPAGERFVYLSETEAKAARSKAGGGTIVPVS